MATTKQRRAAKKLLENPGVGISRIMREVGYSPATAQNPSDLTESKGWKELMEQYLPDATLARVHMEGLSATRMSTSLTAPDIELPDFPTRHKYLETGYKLKGKLTPKDEGGDNGLVVNIMNFIQNHNHGGNTTV